MANNGFNNYQSGGSYNSPNKAIETSVMREYNKEIEGLNLATMSVEDAMMHWENVIRNFTSKTQASSGEIEETISRLRQFSKNFDNAVQFSKQATTATTKEVARNSEYMKGLQTVRGTDPNNNGPLGQVNSSLMKQLVHAQYQNVQLLTALNEKFDQNNENTLQNQAQQEDLFDTLGRTVIQSALNNPTANKLGQLGSSLISAGLFSVASNEHMPAWAQKMAMGAVYLQIPQTLMGIIGSVVQTSLSQWLMSSAAPILSASLRNISTLAGSSLSGLLGGASKFIMSALPVALPVILAGAGIYALIKGISDHRKNMKEKDAEIANDPTLTQGQKDRKRLATHTASGAKTGAISGALIGAAIGTVIAPGIGTAIGGAIGGGALGGLLGGMVGSLKPLGSMLKHGFSSLGSHIMSGAKWAKENKDKIIAFLNPALSILQKVCEVAFPFFTIVKLAVEKIANWVKGFSGGKGDGDGGGGGDTPISLDKSKGGRPKDEKLVDLRDVKSLYDVQLKGSLQSAGQIWGNSKPWTTKENLATFAYLDNTLADMGVKAVYSSNMGGNHATGSDKSHSAGSKVDVVGQSWTPEQYKAMYDKGFFGRDTGALGYEYYKGQKEAVTPEEYARLYKEKGGKMMGGNNHYDLTNKASLITVSSDDKYYDEYMRIKKAVADEKKAKEDATQQAVETIQKDNIVQTVMQPASNLINKDISGTDTYTKLNTTNSVLTIGGTK